MPFPEVNNLYGFVFGVMGDRAGAEAFLLRHLKAHSRKTAGEAVKGLLPELWKACEQTPTQEPAFPELKAEPRLQWALQILAGLEPEDRALILMRDQLEWPLSRIADAFRYDEKEAGNRLRLARLHFFRQKEVLLNRRKRRP